MRRLDSHPRGGRGGGSRVALRLQGRHLPHVRRHAQVGADPRPAQWKGQRPGRRDRPDMYQRPRGADRNRAMTTTQTESKASTNGHEPENPLDRLTAEQIEAIGKEFDELHEQVKSDLGERDAAYIRGIISLQRRLARLGRVILLGSRFRAPWVVGASTLGVAKILENMEIGHNVLHGQWDWMNDPVINSQTWDWDTASTAQSWKHSHNYIHHTYTNIRGKDKDLGYEIMRIDPHQKWHPVYLAQPFYNALLMAFFEWGVAFHDLDIDAIRAGEKSQKEVLHDLKGMGVKARSQIVKDYIAYPTISTLLMAYADRNLHKQPEPDHGRVRRVADRVWRRRPQRSEHPALEIAKRLWGPTFRSTLTADVTANIIRNVWAHAIIF